MNASANFLDRRQKFSAAAAIWIAAAMLAANGRAQTASPQIAARPSKASPKPRPDLARFRARVEAILAQPAASRLDWGMQICDRDTGETLFELNADHFFAPASNAKIVTTALALATLGADFQFHTTLESKATLGADGRLAGDLILVGRGDPDLSNRKFPFVGKSERSGAVEKTLAEMADEAVAKGLRTVDGDIIADDSYFPYDPYPAGWSDGDLFFQFGAPVSAIAFNENTISVVVEPGEHPGDPAIVRTEPAAALDTFTESIATASPDAKPDFAVVRQPGVNFILLRGTIPLGHGPVRLDIAMTAPAETAAATLKQLLESRGVRVTGGTRVRHSPPPFSNPAGEPIIPDPIPPAAESDSIVLADHVSPPLLESIRLTNKISHNLHAELLLRAVGREKLGVGSTAAGLKVERDFLRSAGIAEGDILLSDGSGLARDDLVTPRAIVALLRYASRQPWGHDFLSTLPVAGVDGTLEGRMTGTAASGLIEAKTGEIEHVRALSGYATTLHGQFLVFGIFFNNNPAHGSDTAAPVDAIATAMVETLGVPAHPKNTR